MKIFDFHSAFSTHFAENIPKNHRKNMKNTPTVRVFTEVVLVERWGSVKRSSD